MFFDLLTSATTPPPVLVVDDQAVNRRVLGHLLGRLGVDCRYAADGGEAICLAGKRRWGALLLDIEMRGLDGDVAAARMRSMNAHLGRVAMIAVTSLPPEEAWRRCRAAGMDGVLAKPVGLASLRATLDRYAPKLLRCETADPALGSVTRSAAGPELPSWSPE